MKKEKWFRLANVIAGILIAILVLSASVTATLFDRSAYDRMQDQQDLPEVIGISEDTLLANYNALIDYNSVFFTGSLEFPTLPMSESGRIHFEEVKNIFSALQIALIVSATLTTFFCILLLKRRRFLFLGLGGILALLIPAIVICVMAIVGWDRFFVLFHQVFFNNDFWLFDTQTDPAILILPDAFFLNCLIKIVLGIVISAALLITGFTILRKKS